MFQPKWWKQDRDLKEGDIVFFQKKESELDTAWTLGTIDQLVKGRDDLARRAVVRYQNPSENFHRVTDRHIRSLVKIWSIDDQNVDEDLAELQKQLQANGENCDLLDQLVQGGHGDRPGVGAIEGPDGDLDVGPLQSLQVSAISAGTAAEAAKSYTNVMPELLAEESMVVGHLALTQLGLEDLDQHPEQGGEVEEESCQCSLTATFSSLSLNLL